MATGESINIYKEVHSLYLNPNMNSFQIMYMYQFLNLASVKILFMSS